MTRARTAFTHVGWEATQNTATLRAWLTAVGEIARTANTAASIDVLLKRIADTACELMRYDYCAILLSDPSGRRLLVAAAHGLSDEFVARYNADRPVYVGPGPLGEGPSSQAFRTRRPVTVRDTNLVPIFGPWADVPALETPYRAVLSVPLVTGARVFGVLNCYTAMPYDFPPAEISLLEIIADQAAIAIDAAQLRARERAQIADLEQQQALHRRAQAIHQELTRLVLNNAGLDGIATALARLLGCEVTIREGGTMAAPVSTERAMDVVEDPVEDDPEGHYWTTPIVVGQELAGTLRAGPTRAVLGLLERRALEHAATVAALELLRQRTVQEVAWRLRGDLLDDLLASDLRAEDDLTARAAHLGHDLTSPQLLLVVRVDASEFSGVSGGAAGAGSGASVSRLLSVLQSALADAWPVPSFVAARRDHLVVLLPRPSLLRAPDGQAVGQRLVRRTRETGDGTTVSVAIGPVAGRISDIASAYRAALGALDLVQLAGRHERVVSLDQLDVFGLLLQVDRPEALIQFADRLLNVVESYDRQHRAELMLTLRSYLERACNPVETAARLCIHPHTLAYRLRRIEELTGLNLRRPDNLLRVQLSLMVRDVLGNGSDSA